MKGGTAMKEQRTAKGSTSSHVWEHLEEFVREHVQRFIQALLEEQSRSWWGDRSPSGGQRWMRPPGTAMGTASRGGSC